MPLANFKRRVRNANCEDGTPSRLKTVKRGLAAEPYTLSLTEMIQVSAMHTSFNVTLVYMLVNALHLLKGVGSAERGGRVVSIRCGPSLGLKKVLHPAASVEYVTSQGSSELVRKELAGVASPPTRVYSATRNFCLHFLTPFPKRQSFLEASCWTPGT